MQQLNGERLLFQLQYDLSNKYIEIPMEVKFNSYIVNSVKKIRIKMEESCFPFAEIYLYGLTQDSDNIYEPSVIQRVYPSKIYQYSFDKDSITIKVLRNVGGKKRKLDSLDAQNIRRYLADRTMDPEEISEAYNISLKLVEELGGI